MLAFPKPSRYRDKVYLDYIRMRPCCLCRANPPSRPHHLSFISGTGQGTKPSDLYTVPLCDICHRTVHDKGQMKEHFAIVAARMLGEWIMSREEDYF